MLCIRGPGVWAYRPVIEAWVDIGDLEDCPSNTLPGFSERLTAWLPSLIEHRCSVGERGGFLQRLRDGTWPAHIMEHVTLELQALAGMPGGLGRARETSQRGVYKVAVRAWYEPVTRAALYAARDLVMAAIEDRPYDVAAAVDALRDIAEPLRLGPSTECIVDAADDRDIPAIRLGEANLVQLGYGARQRRIWTAETDRTGAIAEGICSDKDLTRSLLKACGVPVPEGRLVESIAQAWEAAQDIGLPVVVKPIDGNHGRGVFTNLISRQEVETAFGIAVDEGSGVVVERFIPGDEHRLLIVGGRLVAAARGEAATVIGDGVSTVAQLIEQQLNSDPRRGRGEDQPLNIIRLDSAAQMEIARQGFERDSIPAQGVCVVIQRNGNVSIDVTDQVHPKVAGAVCLAAKVVGLDIAGVDLVAKDIAQPLQDQGGAIVEVNAGPGLLMHLKPASGRPRDVGAAIIDNMFPHGDAGRIPIVGISGSHGKTLVARLLTRLLQMAGLYTGLACSDGLYLQSRHVDKTAGASWEAARRLLLNRAVQAAVIEQSARGILTEGLAYDRCHIGVVTGVDPGDLLPDLDIHDADRLANVLRTQVDVVLSDGVAVLNADDERVAEMASLCDGGVILYSLRPDSERIAQHRVAGGRAVLVQGSDIVLAEASTLEILMAVDDLPRHDAHGPRRLSALLPAVAAAWALGLDHDIVRTGIRTFDVMESVQASPVGLAV